MPRRNSQRRRPSAALIAHLHKRRGRPRGRPRNETGLRSNATLHHHLLGLGNRLRRIQNLRTGVSAVHDRVAEIQLEWILERVKSLRSEKRTEGKEGGSGVNLGGSS